MAQELENESLPTSGLRCVTLPSKKLGKQVPLGPHGGKRKVRRPRLGDAGHRRLQQVYRPGGICGEERQTGAKRGSEVSPVPDQRGFLEGLARSAAAVRSPRRNRRPRWQRSTNASKLSRTSSQYGRRKSGDRLASTWRLAQSYIGFARSAVGKPASAAWTIQASNGSSPATAFHALTASIERPCAAKATRRY